MPGNHPEDSVGDCITSVLDENPELDEESAARICNAELKADLDAEQKAALIEVEKAIATVDDTDRARALGERVAQKLSGDTVDQHAEDSAGELVMAFLDDWEGTDGSEPNVSDLQEWVDGTDRTELEAAVDLAGLIDDFREENPNVDLGEATVSDFLRWLGTQASDAGQKTAAATGQHAPVQPAAVQPAKVDKVDFPDIDPQDPPEEFAEALQADSFILYGKASIEQFDRGGETSDVPEILDMDAIEAALDRFFESEKAPGIVSIAHDDIPVGRPLREYTLDEDATIEVDGEIYEFEAGETLTTHVEDGDGDGKPELWALSDIANDTDIARKVRLAVLMGELDGYSVTFGRHADGVEPEGPGRRVKSLDLFSWTLAPGDMVANPGAEFDLAAFKAKLGLRSGDQNQHSQSPTTRADDATDVPSVAEELVRDLDQFIDPQ